MTLVVTFNLLLYIIYSIPSLQYNINIKNARRCTFYYVGDSRFTLSNQFVDFTPSICFCYVCACVCVCLCALSIIVSLGESSEKNILLNYSVSKKFIYKIMYPVYSNNIIYLHVYYIIFNWFCSLYRYNMFVSYNYYSSNVTNNNHYHTIQYLRDMTQRLYYQVHVIFCYSVIPNYITSNDLYKSFNIVYRAKTTIFITIYNVT